MKPKQVQKENDAIVVDRRYRYYSHQITTNKQVPNSFLCHCVIPTYSHSLVTMVLSYQDIMEVVRVLCEDRGLSITVKESGKGALVTGGVAGLGQVISIVADSSRAANNPSVFTITEKAPTRAYSLVVSTYFVLLAF